MARERTGSLIEKQGKLYARIRWTDERGKAREINRRVSNRTEGRHLLRQLIAKLGGENPFPFEVERKTFADLHKLFIETHATPPTYANGIKVSGLRTWQDVRRRSEVLLSHFGKMRLQSITWQSLAQFKAQYLTQPLQRKQGHRTLADCHRMLTILRTMLNIAVREGWLSVNPFKRGKPLINASVERPRERVLSREEERRLLATCHERRTEVVK